MKRDQRGRGKKGRKGRGDWHERDRQHYTDDDSASDREFSSPALLSLAIELLARLSKGAKSSGSTQLLFISTEYVNECIDFSVIVA